MTGSSYDTIRLETQTGTVISWFAPTFEVIPQDRNDAFEAPRGREDPAVVRDNGLWTSELTVQGTYYHSRTVPPDFESALQSLFGQETVTPLDQINRLREYTVYSEPSSKHFYHRENEYTATSSANIDVESGAYPAVTVTELQMPEDGGTSTEHIDFMVRLSVGVERS